MEKIRTSLKRQFKSKHKGFDTFKIKVPTTTIKEYHASDLPVYKKWNGVKEWMYRCRIVDGKIKCDLLKVGDGDFEYSLTSLDATFGPDNKDITEDEWRNGMHKFMKYLRK